MKKITNIAIVLFFFIGMTNTQAQATKQKCEIKYSMFKGDVSSKQYDRAYDDWLWVMENCPKLSLSTYQLGVEIAEHKTKSNKAEGVALMNKIYKQRFENFPNEDKDDVAKAYNNWANFLTQNGGAKEEIFDLLEKSFKTDVTGISPVNLFKYFDVILERNKNTNVQKVLDTYDEVIEGIEKQKSRFTGYLNTYSAKEEAGTALTKKEAKKLRIAKSRMKNFGLLVDGLDGKIEALMTCDRLIPLYKRDFDANKSNAEWLKRAAIRMKSKGCRKDPLFEKLVRSYTSAQPSSLSYSLLASVLESNGKSGEAAQMRTKSFELETDPIKKSNYKLSFAYDAKEAGQKAKARTLAREALALNPSNGRAYLLIAGMYASSANSCGNDAFTKKMTFVAALAKARKAKQVDPSIQSHAQRMINSYSSLVPTTTDVFEAGKTSGASHRVGCWIGETVRIP